MVGGKDQGFRRKKTLEVISVIWGTSGCEDCGEEITSLLSGNLSRGTGGEAGGRNVESQEWGGRRADPHPPGVGRDLGR